MDPTPSICISRDCNGLYFCDRFVAKELVSFILTRVDYKSVANCRLVCKQWREIISDPLFWKHKTELEKRKWPSVPRDENIPWSFYACVYIFGPIDRNIIKNHNGADKLKHWKVLSQAGDGFAFEKPPAGCDSVPKEAENGDPDNSCFATSYHSCSKEQTIDLEKLGINACVLKICKPKIAFKDWYAGRFDCGCVYECRFSLLDQEKKEILHFEYRDNISQWEGREWHKIEHCFEEYPDIARFVKFYHGGTDKQFWAGHYGAKMTGSSITISFT